MCGCNAEIEDTEHFLLRCHFYSIQRFELFNNINKADPSFTQLDTEEQVNIMLYGYRSNKPNALNQDIIKSVITFLKKSGRLDKPLINLNQWFYVLLFFFLPICLLCVFCFFFVFLFWFLFLILFFFLLENKCKCAAYNWLQTSCINTLLLTNSSLILVLLFVWPDITCKH